MTSWCFMTLLKRRSKSSPLSRKSRRKPGSTSKARAKAAPRAVALAEVKDDFSKYLRLAADEEIVITRHGRPAGVLRRVRTMDLCSQRGAGIASRQAAGA